jgi:hypothetical protein
MTAFALGLVGFIDGNDLALSGYLFVPAEAPLHITPHRSSGPRSGAERPGSYLLGRGILLRDDDGRCAALSLIKARSHNDKGCSTTSSKSFCSSTISVRTPPRVSHHWSGSKFE